MQKRKALRAAMRREARTLNELRVLDAIADYPSAIEGGCVWAQTTTLARKGGTSDDMAQRAMLSLRYRGLLRFADHRGKAPKGMRLPVYLAGALWPAHLGDEPSDEVVMTPVRATTGLAIDPTTGSGRSDGDPTTASGRDPTTGSDASHRDIEREDSSSKGEEELQQPGESTRATAPPPLPPDAPVRFTARRVERTKGGSDVMVWCDRLDGPAFARPALGVQEGRTYDGTFAPPTGTAHLPRLASATVVQTEEERAAQHVRDLLDTLDGPHARTSAAELGALGYTETAAQWLRDNIRRWPQTWANDERPRLLAELERGDAAGQT